MNIQLFAYFPYSRQTTSINADGSFLVNKKIIINEIGGKHIEPTTIGFYEVIAPKYDMYKPEYRKNLPATYVVDIADVNDLLKKAGLPKQTIEKWGVGTSHWAA